MYLLNVVTDYLNPCFTPAYGITLCRHDTKIYFPLFVCVYIYVYIYLYLYTYTHAVVDRSCIWKKR